MKLKKFPKNKQKVIRLIEFFNEILDICDTINVNPMLDGSLAVFLYSNDSEIIVNDIDLTYSEKHFPKIEKVLKEHGFNAEIKEWYVLQCRKDDLKVEFSDPDYWYPGVSIESDAVFEFNGKKVDVLKCDSLIKYYEIGVENLKKGLPEKQQKYNDVQKKLNILLKFKQKNS